MTTPNQPTELDKAIKTLISGQWALTPYPIQVAARLVVERLKEIEKENAEFHRTEPLKKQERDFFAGFFFNCIQNTPHPDCITETECMERVISTLKSIDQLHTAYKQALENIKIVEKEFPSFGELYPEWRDLINTTSTPLAIETLKKGSNE